MCELADSAVHVDPEAGRQTRTDSPLPAQNREDDVAPRDLDALSLPPRSSGAARPAVHGCRRECDPPAANRLGIEAARALQQRLSAQVIEIDRFGALQRIAGADVSYDRGSSLMCAAVVVQDAASGETLEISCAARHVRFPYVPGYLSFRELPPLADAFARLRHMPDLILCDGHGRAHPRRFGLACHVGVAFDRPSIGCAKSRLVGTHREPGRRRGAHAPLVEAGETLGSALRTRDDVRAIFVSIGHRVSLSSARAVVLAQCRGHRIPDPLRAAHDAANALRRAQQRGPSLALP